VRREEKVDRLHCPGIGPVLVEVKIAEQQTGPDLEATLPKQLVGHYMRDRHSEFGILFVFSLGDNKTFWRTRDGRELGLINVRRVPAVAFPLP